METLHVDCSTRAPVHSPGHGGCRARLMGLGTRLDHGTHHAAASPGTGVLDFWHHVPRLRNLHDAHRCLSLGLSSGLANTEGGLRRLGSGDLEVLKIPLVCLSTQDGTSEGGRERARRPTDQDHEPSAVLERTGMDMERKTTIGKGRCFGTCRASRRRGKEFERGGNLSRDEKIATRRIPGAESARRLRSWLMFYGTHGFQYDWLSGIWKYWDTAQGYLNDRAAASEFPSQYRHQRRQHESSHARLGKARSVWQSFQTLCGILSEESRRASYHLSLLLGDASNEVVSVLEPYVAESIGSPNTSWSHERCIIEYVTALIINHRESEARDCLRNVEARSLLHNCAIQRFSSSSTL
ncbi:hypothetical protein N657DRAFT_702576 [Parathielavia appendiculata]|uniref:Uncharacterized protein n=1 Tax=Parathielavia appendiculata TaxID=2587402 RepID=A0AAN6TSW2_9PEZI|nr:hypothetical protein N657DRAFT_702576 [Parathielavia appendiculata]